MPEPRGLYMSVTEQFTFNVLNDFGLGKIKRSEAAMMLGITERSVTRKASRFRTKGLPGVQHGNKGKTPPNRVSDDLQMRVIKLVREKYFDFNATHCLERLKKDEGFEISYSVFYRWLKKAGLIKRTKRRNTHPRFLRSRLPCEGLMLQMDGSHHAWNGKDEWVLIAVIDDATSKIPWAEFFTSEDTLNCMTVLQRVIEKVGIPEMIYTDKAGWFGGTTKREGFNNFTAACELLGIRVIFAGSAQAKGRIERSWSTFQDRLIPELRLTETRTIPAANEFMQKEFLPNYWDVQNTVEPRSEDIRYRQLPAGVDLDQILCLKETRWIKGDHTVSWKSEIYRVFPPAHVSLKDRQIELRTYQDLTTKAFFADREIRIERIKEAPAEKSLRVNRVAGIGREALKSLKEQVRMDLVAPIKRKRGRPRKVTEAPAPLAKAS